MRSLFRNLPLIFILIVLAGGSAANAQDNAGQQPDIETLKQQFDQQRSEIENLRSELKKESELREQQQALLEKLMDRLDKLSGATSAKSETATTVPVAMKTSAAAMTTTPTDQTQKPQDKPANAVESGFGKVKFDGLLQGWFAAGDRGFSNTFRIRRAELRFSGEIMPDVKWSVMFDPAKALSVNTATTSIDGTPVVRSVSVNQASRAFQEAYVQLTHFKHANFQFGQFKIPLSQEGLQSTAALDTIDRALFMSDRSRGGTFGDTRELGAMVYGPLGKQFDYQAGVFNGAGETLNDVDTNNEKAFVGRFVFHPMAIKGLSIGTSGLYAPDTTIVNPQHQRLGFESVYQRNKLRLKSEFMMGIDGDIHRRGWYAHAGYRFMPKLEGIFRYDTFDPDTGRETTPASVTERDYITGFNYYIRENNFKVQFNYIRKTFANNITPSRDLFIVNLQTAW
jgi:phosphate-selective porin